MRKINWGNILFSVVAMVVIISLMATTANAAAVTLSDTLATYFTADYSGSSDGGSVTQSGNTLTITAKGGGCSASTGTLTLTVAKACEVSWTLDSGTLSNSDQPATGKTFYDVGETLKFAVNAAKNATATATITITVTAVEVTYPSGGVHYTAVNDATGEKRPFGYIDQAIEFTKQSNGTYNGTVIVTESGNLMHSADSNNITIPAGVTLLLPRISSDTTVGNADDELPYANYDTWNGDSRWVLNPAKNRYLLLTIPRGVTVNNNGMIVLGGSIAAKDSYFNGGTLSQDDGVAGHTHSDIVLNGTINMGDYSVLSSIGYITGSGTINANGTGAKIYQPFVVNDYHGAHYVAGAAGKAGNLDYSIDLGIEGAEDTISPFIRYTMQNIQTTIKMTAGNYMYGYCDLYASKSHNQTTACIVGDSSVDGLINLKAGATFEAQYLGTNKVKHYDAFKDGDPNNDGTRGGIDGWGYNQVGRTKLTINGGASLGALTLTIDTNIEVSLGSVTFPVPYNYDIYLNAGANNTAATYDINTSMMLLPGASMTVSKNATLSIGDGTNSIRFMVMDGLFDHTGEGVKKSYGTASDTAAYREYTDFTYPKTGELQAEDLSGTGVLKLNGGKLVVNSQVMFGGLVQTDGSADTQISFNGINKCDIRIGLAGSNSLSFAAAGATYRTLNAMVMDSTGRFVTMQNGKTYRGAAFTGNNITTYSYTLYTSSGRASETHTETAGKVCDNCATCQLKYGSEKARCVCNIFSPIAVSGMWYDYTLTVKEAGKDDVVYYHLGGKLYTADGEVTTHTITDGYGAVVTSGGGVKVAASDTTLTFSEVNLTADTVVTVSASCAHTPGEAVYGNFNTTNGTCDMVVTCTKCGEELSSASEYVVRFSGLNVELNADIYLTYTLYILDENATIVLTKPDPWDNTKTVTKEISVVDLNPDANGKYAVQMEIASGEMSRNVTIQVLDRNRVPYQMFKNSNRSSLGNETAFSVLSYAEIVLGKDENAEGLPDTDKQSIIAKKEIVTALLTYGGYAQAYFDVDAENPAYNLLSEYSIDIPSLADIGVDKVNDYVVTKGGNTELGITAKSYNPCLDYSVSFQLGFALNEGENIDSYSFMLQRPGTEDTEELEATYDAAKDRYYVDVSAIPSGYLNDDYIVYVYKTGNDEPYTVEASILAWSRIILNRETAEEVDKNMAKALYLYSDAADTYFNK